MLRLANTHPAWYPCAVDGECTIEFILESQAKTETRLTGITKLLQQGMRMLAKTDGKLAELAEAEKRTQARLSELAGAQKETAQAIKDLAKAQLETERTLQAFIKGQRNGRNSR